MIQQERLVKVIAELEIQLGLHELEGNRPAVNSLQYIKDLLDECIRIHSHQEKGGEQNGEQG